MKKYKYPFFLLIVFLLLFSPVFFSGFAYDDIAHIVNDKALHTQSPFFFFFNSVGSPVADSFFSFYYRPLPFFIFSLIYKTFGLKAIFFHLFQMSLFLSVIYLIFLFFSSFFSSFIAFILTLTFLVHPISQSMAAYICDSIYTTFIFFGLCSLSILRSRLSELKKASLSAFFLLLAFLSNEAGILFAPLVIYYAGLERKVRVKILFPAVFFAGTIYLFLRNLSWGHYFTKYLTSHPMNEPLFDRVIRVPVIVYYYFLEIFAPKASVPKIAEIISHPPNFLSLIFFYSFLFGAFFSFLIYFKKKNRGVVGQYLFFTFWFLWGLSLYVQIIPIDTFIARRFLSFSLIGGLGLLGVVISRARFFNKKSRRLILVIYLIFLFVLSLQTLKSNLAFMDWQNHLAQP